MLMQLLGELLLDRSNVKVMMRYVSDSKNLQMMMMLLKDNSRSIQFEAFHVFKVQQTFTSTARAILVSEVLACMVDISVPVRTSPRPFYRAGRLCMQGASLMASLQAAMSSCAELDTGASMRGSTRCRTECALTPYFGPGRLLLIGASLVAQVFVANPNKTPKITELLQHNKDKLLRYLGDFHTDKGVCSTNNAGCVLVAVSPETLTGPPKAHLPCCPGKVVYRSVFRILSEQYALQPTCDSCLLPSGDALALSDNRYCCAEDEQFKEEKAVIIKEISMLEPSEQDEQY